MNKKTAMKIENIHSAGKFVYIHTRTHMHASITSQIK